MNCNKPIQVDFSKNNKPIDINFPDSKESCDDDVNFGPCVSENMLNIKIEDETKRAIAEESKIKESVKNVETTLETKVDKEEGKELSTNDFTDEDKSKLDSLQNYDDTTLREEVNKNSNSLLNDVGVRLFLDNESHEISLINAKGTILSTIDLPLEELVKDVTYDSQTKILTITWENNKTSNIELKGLIDTYNADEVTLTLENNVFKIKQSWINQLDEKINDKVSKETGKGLSTNDFTNDDKNKLNNLQNYDDTQIKKDLENKVDKIDGKGLSSNDFTTEEKEKLASLKNYDDKEIKNELTNKVDKEIGKGLSTNDFTNDYKKELDEVSNVYETKTDANSKLENAKKYTDDKLVNYISKSEKGTNNGVATLGADGRVPASQLPAGIDEIKEYPSLDKFPITGDSTIIYVALDTNKTYRWSGTKYTVIGSDLALGETAETAYAGNKGAKNREDIELLKTDKVDKETGKGLSSNDFTTDEKNKLAGLENYNDSEIKSELNNKVDKVPGKVLSSNDYTNVEKEKLAGIEDNANKYVLPSDVVQDSNYVHTDNNYTPPEKEKLASLENYDDTEIKKQINGKVDKFNEITINEEFSTRITANGYNVEDNSIAQVKSIKGKTEKCTNILDIESAIGKPENSALTKIGDNTYVLTKVNINIRAGNINCEIPANTEFTLNMDASKILYANGTLHIRFRLEDGSFVGDSEYFNEIPKKTFTFAKKVTLVNLYVLADASDGTKLEFSKIQINYGSQVKPFEPYYDGLHSAKPTKLVSTGTQIWDEKWEVGGINWNGTDNPVSNAIRSKYQTIAPNVTVYANFGVYGEMFFYDKDKNFILMAPCGLGKSLILPSNTAYFRFRVGSSYGTTYKNDIMLNLGTEPLPYEPYIESTLSISQEIQNIEGYGLGVNDIKNEVDFVNKKFYRRVIKIKGSDIIWNYQPDKKLYAGILKKEIVDVTNSQISNIICSEYETTNYNTIIKQDNYISGAYSVKILYVRDDKFNGNNELFREHIKNVEIVYEIKTPEIIDLPVEQDENYLVYNQGTEKWVTEYGMPVSCEIEYYSVVVNEQINRNTKDIEELNSKLNEHPKYTEMDKIIGDYMVSHYDNGDTRGY